MTDTDFEGFADDLGDLIPDSLPDDTYLCELVKCEINKGKDGRRWLVFNWGVIEDGDYFGEEIGPEMFQIFTREEFKESDPEKKKFLRNTYRRRIQRLESLGLSKSDLEKTNPADLVGIKAHLKVRIRPKNDGPGDNCWIDSIVLANSVKDTVSISEF